MSRSAADAIDIIDRLLELIYSAVWKIFSIHKEHCVPGRRCDANPAPRSHRLDCSVMERTLIGCWRGSEPADWWVSSVGCGRAVEALRLCEGLAPPRVCCGNNTFELRNLGIFFSHKYPEYRLRYFPHSEAATVLWEFIYFSFSRNGRWHLLSVSLLHKLQSKTFLHSY